MACVQANDPNIRPKKTRTPPRHPPDPPRTPAPGIPAECRARVDSGAERSAADTQQERSRAPAVGRCGLHMIPYPSRNTKAPHRASHAVVLEPNSEKAEKPSQKPLNLTPRPEQARLATQTNYLPTAPAAQANHCASTRELQINKRANPGRSAAERCTIKD